MFNVRIMPFARLLRERQKMKGETRATRPQAYDLS
jgi:hypothetical protein